MDSSDCDENFDNIRFLDYYKIPSKDLKPDLSCLFDKKSNKPFEPNANESFDRCESESFGGNASSTNASKNRIKKLSSILTRNEGLALKNRANRKQVQFISEKSSMRKEELKLPKINGTETANNEKKSKFDDISNLVTSFKEKRNQMRLRGESTFSEVTTHESRAKETSSSNAEESDDNDYSDDSDVSEDTFVDDLGNMQLNELEEGLKNYVKDSDMKKASAQKDEVVESLSERFKKTILNTIDERIETNLKRFKSTLPTFPQILPKKDKKGDLEGEDEFPNIIRFLNRFNILLDTLKKNDPYGNDIERILQQNIKEFWVADYCLSQTTYLGLKSIAMDPQKLGKFRGYINENFQSVMANCDLENESSVEVPKKVEKKLKKKNLKPVIEVLPKSPKPIEVAKTSSNETVLILNKQKRPELRPKNKILAQSEIELKMLKKPPPDSEYYYDDY